VPRRRTLTVEVKRKVGVMRISQVDLWRNALGMKQRSRRSVPLRDGRYIWEHMGWGRLWVGDGEKIFSNETKLGDEKRLAF
jgi:hypothetical protein